MDRESDLLNRIVNGALLGLLVGGFLFLMTALATGMASGMMVGGVTFLLAFLAGFLLNENPFNLFIKLLNIF